MSPSGSVLTVDLPSADDLHGAQSAGSTGSTAPASRARGPQATGASGRDEPTPGRPARETSAPFDLRAEYDANGSALFGFAINALRDRALAEDCVQETFLRAWRARDRFDPARASARTWLFAIERNVIADVLRSLERMPRIASADLLDDLPAETADELDRLQVLEALAKLSEEHRSAVVAVHLRGASYAEVSAASGVPVATVRTRVFYALRSLRGHLEGAAGAGGPSTSPPPRANFQHANSQHPDPERPDSQHPDSQYPDRKGIRNV